MIKFFYSSIQLMRVDNPIGTVLLACPMLWALWLSTNGNPPANIVFIFLIGAFLMRSAGCVINDFADKDIDLKVKRTKGRPLTSGNISVRSSLILFIFLIVIAISLLILLPNTVIIPAIIAFSLSLLYPFTKRFFIFPQLVLGLSFSMSILMVYLAIDSNITLTAWLLFCASTIWTIIYDTFYAMVDKDDDVLLGINSSALLFANKDILICLLLTVCFLLIMLVIGIVNGLGVYYYLGVVFSSFCFIYQFFIVKKRKKDLYFVAFLNNQWVGVFIFVGILLDSLKI